MAIRSAHSWASGGAFLIVAIAVGDVDCGGTCQVPEADWKVTGALSYTEAEAALEQRLARLQGGIGTPASLAADRARGTARVVDEPRTFDYVTEEPADIILDSVSQRLYTGDVVPVLLAQIRFDRPTQKGTYSLADLHATVCESVDFEPPRAAPPDGGPPDAATGESGSPADGGVADSSVVADGALAVDGAPAGDGAAALDGALAADGAPGGDAAAALDGALAADGAAAGDGAPTLDGSFSADAGPIYGEHDICADVAGTITFNPSGSSNFDADLTLSNASGPSDAPSVTGQMHVHYAVVMHSEDCSSSIGNIYGP
jgi:hypothetical protein